MNKCTNHPDTDTALVCHSCGKPYCESCLTEAGNYLYCSSYECITAMNSEKKVFLNEKMICPVCENELTPDYDEKSTGLVHCTRCDNAINFKKTPPEIIKPLEYTEMFMTMNQGDIAVIKSVMDSAKIDYYVTGENFLSVEPLIQPAKFFVSSSQVEEVKALLEDFKLHIYGVSDR